MERGHSERGALREGRGNVRAEGGNSGSGKAYTRKGCEEPR